MEKKYSDEEVNQIVTRKYAVWKKKQQKIVDELQQQRELSKIHKQQCDKLMDELEELRSKQEVTNILIDVIRKGTVC